MFLSNVHVTKGHNVMVTQVIPQQDVGRINRANVVGLLLAIGILFISFWPTFYSIVKIWIRSETFAHGFLIFPISLYLIWRKRYVLANVEFSTDLRSLVVIGMAGFVWLLAKLGSVQVVEQLSFVAFIPLLVWLFLGLKAVKTIIFPLFFMFFAVPMGESLILPLMHFTAHFTVGLIRLTGIPVYSEGTFFSIPSGDWSVVEGCSGVRYLIASVTLGVLYAYLSYKSIWRRLAFIILAAVFPIVANGLRAYMIVMIADLSDMRYALGFDHLIYGWVFFGFVIFMMFWIGSFWSDKDVSEVEGKPENAKAVSKPEDELTTDHGPLCQSTTKFVYKKSIRALVLGVCILLVWPVWADFSHAPINNSVTIAAKWPNKIGAWKLQDNNFSMWSPLYRKPTMTSVAEYKNRNDTVGIYIAYYNRQHQGAELINSRNRFVKQKDPVWRQVAKEPVYTKHGTVTEAILKSDDQNLLAWRWTWMDGNATNNAFIGKLYEIRSKLKGRYGQGFGVVIYTSMNDTLPEARAKLSLFLDTAVNGVYKSVFDKIIQPTVSDKHYSRTTSIN